MSSASTGRAAPTFAAVRPWKTRQIVGLVAGIVAVCIFFGLLAVAVGSSAATDGFYLFGFVGAGVAAGLALLRAAEPRHFAFVALLVLFPYIARFLPPGRLGVSSFDVVMLLVLVSTIFNNLWRSDDQRFKFFPAPSLWALHLILIPCVVFAQFPKTALWIYLENYLYYFFFLIAIEEFKKPGGFDRIVKLMSYGAIITCIGILVEGATGINVSLSPKNINALNPSITGRFSGFFADPQTAGDFLACYIALATTLLFRKRVEGRVRTWLIAGLLAGLIGLVATGSRSALGAAVLAVTTVLFLLNGWSVTTKAICLLLAAFLLAVIWSVGPDLAAAILPSRIVRRFSSTDGDFRFRLMIWRSTWSMFESHPWQGVGLGGFRQYLEATRPVSTSGIAAIPGARIYSVLAHPESGYLKVLYESGLLGVAALTAFIGATAQRAYKVIRYGTAHARTDVIAAIAGLIVFAMTFFTVFMLPDERNATIVLIMFGLIWARSFEMPAAETLRRVR